MPRRALLQEKGVTWRSHWGDVKPLIADDPRYAAMPRGERDVYFRRYRDELEVRVIFRGLSETTYCPVRSGG